MKNETFTSKVKQDVCLKSTQTPELVKLSNRLLIAAMALDNPAIYDDNDTQICLLNELNSISKKYEESSYELKWDIIKLITNMENMLL